MLSEENAKSLALKHPWLTGIPTLGIWPAVSKERAAQDIRRRLFRQYPELVDQWQESMQQLKQEAMERQKLQVEQDRANAARNAVLAAGTAGSQLLSAYGRNRDTTKTSSFREEGRMSHKTIDEIVVSAAREESEKLAEFLADAAIEGAVEELQKVASANDINLTQEEAIAFLKEAGFWDAMTKTRNLPGVLGRGKEYYVPGVPYEGSLAAKGLSASEKVVGKAAKGVGKRVAKNIGRKLGIVAPKPSLIERAFKGISPEKAEKLMRALGLLGAGGAAAGSGYLLFKGDDEPAEAEKTSAVNPLMLGIPIVTGHKTDDLNALEATGLGAGLGALLKSGLINKSTKGLLQRLKKGGVHGALLGAGGYGLAKLLGKGEE
jgi:hypothetical protein